MEARAFAEADYAELARWFKAHRLAVPKLERLAPTGFIVEGVAAGFAYICDGRIAVLEHFISSPDASAEERDAALDEITERLFAQAQARGCWAAIGTTQLNAMRARAERHGMRDFGQYHYLLKEL